MVKILEGSTGAADFARTLHDLTRRVQALERSTQASHTSIEGGAMDIYDETGELKGSVGVQPDGGVALVPVNPAPPPTPTAPVVEPVLAGLVVGWDGTWADAYDTPSDFALVQVHVGTAADFVPSLATQVAAITAQAGGSTTIALEGYAPRWVRLVGQNTGQATGPPSAAVPGTPRQAVGQDLLDGIIGEVKLAKDAVTSAKIALGAVTDAALAAGAVTMNALGGALADGVTQRYVDAMGDPKAWQVLNQAAGASWEHLPATDAPTGRTLARATGYTVVRGTVQVPYDPDVLYRISVRVRTLTGSASGTDTLYIGALGIAADGITLVNRNGANLYASGHYVAASNAVQPPSSGWRVYTGYLRGRAAPGASGTGGTATDPRAPGVMHADTRFISPLLFLNFASGTTGGSGVMDVDAVTIEVLKTGVVDSTNLVVGSVTTAALATDAVAAGKISADAVTAREIKAGAVNTVALAAGAVTTEKLTALAVTAEKIAALAVTAEKIDALAVTTDKLAVNAVTATKIAAGIIDATHVKAGALSADRLSIGTDGNLIADPSFEGATSVQRAEASPYWSIVSPGNDTPKALQVDATSATAVDRNLALTTAPAQPGQKVWLSADYLLSANWSGSRVVLFARWLDADGAIVGHSTISTSSPVRGSWQQLSGVPDAAAPAGTTQVRVFCATAASTVGTVTFDNVSCRIVLASSAAGARAELSPQGLQLFDDAGDEAVALMTGRPNYLTLSNAGRPVSTIDQNGDAGFSNLSVAGTLEIAGDPLSRILNQYGRGLVAVDYMATAVTAASTEYGYVELAFEADSSRMYRVVFDCYADPSEAGGEIVVALRDGGASTPSINSTQIQSVIRPCPTGRWDRIRLETIRSGAAFGAGLHRLLISFWVRDGPAGQTVRLFGAGPYPGIFYIEDIGPYVPETGVYNTGGGTATPTKKNYTKTYAASWSGSYANRSSYNSYYGNQCIQGYYSSTNGMQAALIGFPAALTSDLSGAVIRKVELYLYYEHWYYNSGGTAVIKAHKHASRPSTFSCDSEFITIPWSRNQGKWVDITSVFDSTSWRGVALDPNSTTQTYYGRARGVGQTYPPQLRVTYTK
ncbi:hypothetical protein HHL19_35325 [Streptomyces sp. R302]|uniref:hypothetical protein n=1 Tax=unclassified Streptomyces TaxID=2593676 RepID=UPI00145F9E20|nr:MULTISPECIES: hypothetical protein [unclassified Streptomyces]NML55186.1 hypothetical protein [Streptomyces sp. R301]NML83784.1 hypothetical protein [Streptomyces sp. R302]